MESPQDVIDSELAQSHKLSILAAPMFGVNLITRAFRDIVLLTIHVPEIQTEPCIACSFHGEEWVRNPLLP